MESKFKEFIQLGNNKNHSTSRHKVTSIHKNPSSEKPILNVSNTQNIPVQKSVFYSQKQNTKITMPHIEITQNQYTRPHHNNFLIQTSMSPKNHIHSTLKSPINIPTTKRILVNSKQKNLPQFSKQNHSPVHRVSKVLFVNTDGHHLQPNFFRKIQQNQSIHRQIIQKQENMKKQIRNLQIRVTQLMNQKISIQKTLNQQNHRILNLNKQLKNKIAEDNIQQVKERVNQLQQMLEGQINKSLQLMDENENLKKKLQEAQSEIISKNTLYQKINNQLKTIQQDKRQTQKSMKKLNIDYESELQKVRTQLQSQIKSLNIQLQKQKLQKVQLDLQLLQKDLELTQLNKKLSDYDFKLQGLQNNLLQKSNIMMGGSIMANSCTSWRTQGVSIMAEDKKQCRKCQDLLKTIFKLNSQLNKK